MTTIISLTGATGTEWYSWPVGTPSAALDGISQHFADKPEAIPNARASITSLDQRLDDSGASVGGVWAPEALNGLIGAQWWAGVVREPEQEEFRSARRYERMINEGAFDTTATVYSRNVTSLFVDDIEVILTIESRADGEGCEPYVRARAVYFPTWTKDRVILEAGSPAYTLVQDFVNEVTAMTSTLRINTSTS